MFRIGASLRQARLARGLELAAAEKATRIRLKYLQALEEERFDVLPGDAYAKGFLREYAEFLGLESRLFLAEYDARCATHVEPAMVPPRQAEPLPLLPRPRRAVLAAIAVLLVGGVLVPFGVAAWPHVHSAPRAAPATVPRVRLASAPAPVVLARPRRPSGPARLVLHAGGGPCWLLVRRGSATGPRLYEGTLASGGTLRFTGRRLWVRVGAPTHLEAWLGGRRVATLPDDVANVVFAAKR
jgi:cytoskeleton protein RodZ